MRRLLIAGVLVVILTRPALAQDPYVGWIGVYADETAGSCQIQDSPGMVHAYIVHDGATEANTSQFKLEIDPAVQMTFLSGVVNPLLLSIGDLLEGITITYRGCRTSFPLTLVTLSFWGDGTTNVCAALRIVADPQVGQVEVVDCHLGVQVAATVPAYVNDTGDCSCPTMSRATIQTSPPGFEIIVDSTTYTGPRTFLWENGDAHEIGAPSPQGGAETAYVFSAWSDGGAATHDIVMGENDTTFTATFELAPRVTLATAPSGLEIFADGVSHAAPHDVFWAPGTSHEIAVSTPQGSDSMYTFVTWSDGGTATHDIVMGENDTTFTATFELAPRVTLDTNPSGYDCFADGNPYATPHDMFWAAGTGHDVSVLEYLPHGDSVLAFGGWSDGGAREHTYTATGTDTTLIASYPAHAVDPGCIRLFTDEAGSNCQLVDAGSQLVDVYVVHSDPAMLNQSLFRVHAGGGVGFTYVGEQSALSTVGDTQQGLQAFYGDCVTSDVLITRITYQTHGDSYPSVLMVATHPQAASANIEAVDCAGVVRNPGGSLLFVNGDGSCECDAGGVSAIDVAVPQVVVLDQNTPNPFNPSTHIEFSVPSPQFVELLVFDVSGSLVKRLFAQEAPKGLTSVNWTGENENGEAVGSGVYFYQLRTRDKRFTRKMVLLK